MRDRVEVAKEVLSRLVDASIKEGRRRSTNFVRVQGVGHLEHYNAECHYGIGTAATGIVCVGTEFAIRRRAGYYKTDTELFRPMAQFLLSCRLWKDYILTDEAFAMDYGAVISSAAPQNILHSFMIASRSFMECSDDAFLLFNEAVAKGLPPEVAYVISFQTNISARDYTGAGVYASSEKGDNFCPYADNVAVKSHTNHRPWNLLGYKGVQCLLDGTYIPSMAYKDFQSTSGTMTLFPTNPGLVKDLFDDRTFHESLLLHRQGCITELYRVPNPFAKPDPSKPRPLPQGEVSIGEWKSVVLTHMLNRYAIREEIRNVA